MKLNKKFYISCLEKSIKFRFTYLFLYTQVQYTNAVRQFIYLLLIIVAILFLSFATIDSNDIIVEDWIRWSRCLCVRYLAYSRVCKSQFLWYVFVTLFQNVQKQRNTTGLRKQYTILIEFCTLHQLRYVKTTNKFMNLFCLFVLSV
jgi:hypothetical protein